MNEERQWPTEWLRGALDVCVLNLVSRGPTYGYAIGVALQEAGLGPIKGGTLYPLLSRLEATDLVEIEWRAGDGGPGRKYYTLSPQGVAELERLTLRWTAFTTLISELITTTTHQSTHQSTHQGAQP